MDRLVYPPGYITWTKHLWEEKNILTPVYFLSNQLLPLNLHLVIKNAIRICRGHHVRKADLMWNSEFKGLPRFHGTPWVSRGFYGAPRVSRGFNRASGAQGASMTPLGSPGDFIAPLVVSRGGGAIHTYYP